MISSDKLLPKVRFHLRKLLKGNELQQPKLPAAADHAVLLQLSAITVQGLLVLAKHQVNINAFRHINFDVETV